MALEESELAQDEAARYGTATAGKRSIPLRLILLATAWVSVILFFGLGFSFAFTQGDSMEPNYHSGSLVIKREVEPTSLEAGDVISFYAPWANRRVMHRVTSIGIGRDGNLWLRTKGDNNPVPDPSLEGCSVCGR
jgi:signal peptidase